MLGKVRTCTLCTYEYVRVIRIPFCCEIRVAKAFRGLSRDCGGNPFVNYLAMTYRIRDVRRGFATYDRRGSARDTMQHIRDICMYTASVVLTKSRANSRSVVRSCMDFHRFSRRRCSAVGESKIECVRVHVSRVSIEGTSHWRKN